MTGISGGLYKLKNGIMKLAHLNILWIVFSFTGFILFGIFPATTAMFAICRKWILGEEDFPIIRTFWKYYKKDFIKTNLFGLTLLIMGVMLYLDYILLLHETNGVIKLILFITIPCSILFVLILLYIFPVYVHYEMKTYDIYINACMIMLFHPFLTSLMLCSSILVIILMIALPGLIPFFGVSLLAWILMYLATISFSRVEQIRQKTNIQTRV
ncbi:YesL family protein [Salibacterium aidingense]|uniref:YesL family protein n=1 Tax=Salibacterium aidingense TaxID=384933 RepID=UPI000418DD2D|nr:DUF624 domain-containing protein [Salibacterium aidingense]